MAVLFERGPYRSRMRSRFGGKRPMKQADPQKLAERAAYRATQGYRNKLNGAKVSRATRVIKRVTPEEPPPAEVLAERDRAYAAFEQIKHGFHGEPLPGRGFIR